MSYPVTCSTCGKTTWNGCGQHVADVRRNVPAAQWCGGHPEQTAAAPATGGGFLGRLFGRS
jgi:hypothetical protein